jgi:hypothetical protein
MKAEELLATGKLALLPLIGQTRIDNPSEVLTEVLERVKKEPDTSIRGRVLLAMGALMEDKEVLAMLEQMIQVMEDELQLDTPFMQRLREAREEGREEGLSLGTLATLRRDILDAVMVRFSPTEQECAQVETHLATMTDETRLRALFRAALRAENMGLFLQDLMQNRNGRQNGNNTTEQSQ